MNIKDPLFMTGAAKEAPRLPAEVLPAHQKPRRRGFEQWHVDHESAAGSQEWLLTYLDVMTLLLVVLVVMLAFSQPIEKSPPVASQAPAASGAGNVNSITGVLLPSIVPRFPELIKQPKKRNPLEGLALDKLGSDVEVIVDGGLIRFRISAEILFGSGEAMLTPKGLEVLDKLLPVLESAALAGDSIVVEGHTDSIPIQTDRFPSNWELSTGRAAMVTRYLISRGLAPARVRASGFADTRPIGANDNPDTRAVNRRVELALEAVPVKPGK